MTPNQGAKRITNVSFTATSPEHQLTGLLGWIDCDYEDRIRLSGIALRRTRDGRLTLSFPSKNDRAGNRRYIVRPLDDEARREIEREIFAWLPVEIATNGAQR